MASGLLTATSLTELVVADCGGKLPSLSFSLEEEAVRDNLALDRPSPTPAPVPVLLPTVDVETAGEVWREDEGLIAFWDVVGSKDDIDVTD